MADPIVPRILNAGECCLVVEFGSGIDLGVNARVQALRRRIEGSPFPGFVETVPTYRSLAVCFDPLRAPDPSELGQRLLNMAETTAEAVDGGGEVVVVPVCYEGEFAPDLGRVAEHTGLAPDEVIRRHGAAACYCYMLGFTPGFSYLGGMDATLETPRLPEPRERIPAGSVGIAGRQTGIYPIDSPGGWNLIGRTPLRLFDPDRPVPIFLNAGMWVRFVPIPMKDFERLERDAACPDWRPEITRRGVGA
ncbi:MAG: 5-oxoprolinase subunit PxpB [Fretibacterium sp.]|nr:5-oxoprolinase subunit PxpB [Fretibacterium sp.]